MAYEDPQIVQEWLDSLNELVVKVKKMFGCYSENRYKFFAPICPFLTHIRP